MLRISRVVQGSCSLAGESHAELDEFENAHRRVGGEGPGRRYLTRQINHAYLVAVAAQFQRFCRDLHSEAAQRLVDAVSPREVQGALMGLLTENRKLDTGNANAATLGPDFDRLGFSFFTEVNAATLAAKVIEDRGNLGAHGEQVVRLAVEDPMIPSEHFEVEVPVDWLAAPPARARR